MEFKYSEETRRRMSEAKKRFFANGGVPWNKIPDAESMKVCATCKKAFRIHSRNRLTTAKFCSIECGKGHNIFYKGFTPWNKGKEHLRGSKHWNWKGGVDKEHTRIKQTKEYQDWQQEVYKQDRWSCRDCKKHCAGGDIVAHHLKPFSKYIKLRFVASNGIVLCRKCHQLRHKPRRKNYNDNPIA
jgi:hypothetical protein